MIYVIYNGAYSGPQVDAAVSRALAGGAIDQAIAAVQAAVSAPLTAATVADMTDILRVYVYTGSEAGYTAGNWYYWNGSAWTSGGIYNAVAVDMALSDSSDNAVANRIVKAAIDANTDAIEAVGETASYVLAAFPTETAAGSVAHTDVGADGVPVKQLLAAIEAVQDGTGDPSPANPRPIAGWASVAVSRSGEDTSSPEVFTVALGQTVYFGTVDFATGSLTITHGSFDLSGRSWNYSSTNDYFYVSLPADCASAIAGGRGGLSSKYKLVNPTSGQDFYDTDFCLTYSNSRLSSNKRVFVTDSRFTDAETFSLSVSGVLIYELGTPLTVHLTPVKVDSLLGATNIWADAGDVSVTFRCDPTLYSQQLLGGE